MLVGGSQADEIKLQREEYAVKMFSTAPVSFARRCKLPVPFQNFSCLLTAEGGITIA